MLRGACRKNLMKENSISVGEWEWCIDDESRLVPWFSIYPEVEEKFTVKATDNACIFRVQDSQKRAYYVKHETPASIKEHVIAWFSSRAKAVFESAQILKAANIPCAEYPGWGKSGTESMLLSVEIPETVSALEYWFRIVPHNAALRREFLSNLSELIGMYVRESVVQQDLTLEHILVKTNGSEMYVISPCEVEKRNGGLSRADKLALLKPFVEVRGEVSSDSATIAILESGIAADSLDASELWHDAIDDEEENIEENYWPENSDSVILDDSGPLCRILRDGEDVTLIRNTIWHTEIPVPDDSNSIAEELSEDEAEKIWMDSFKAQLLRQQYPRVPLSWERHADGRNVIRYAVTVEDMLDSGFDQ